MTIAVITENSSAQNATADNLYSGVVDTRLLQGAPTTNYGTDGDLYASKYGGGNHQNTLIKFEGLSNIPSNAVVSSAILYLRCIETAGAPHNISVYRLLQAWTPSGATWNTKDGSAAWGASGATSSGVDISAAPVVTVDSTAAQYAYQAFEITALVQDIVDGTIATDHGFLLERDGTGNDFRYRRFQSSDSTNSERPELVVEYTAATGPTITDVDTDEIIENGQTGIVVTGSAFEALQVSGDVDIAGVDQTETVWTDTSLTFDFVLGTMKFGAQTLTVTNDSGDSGNIAITVSPEAGHGYVDLTSVSGSDITAAPALAIGDQLEYENTTTPSGLPVSVSAGGVISITGDPAGESFQVRANDGTGWGAWATQSAAGGFESEARNVLFPIFRSCFSSPVK